MKSDTNGEEGDGHCRSDSVVSLEVRLAGAKRSHITSTKLDLAL